MRDHPVHRPSPRSNRLVSSCHAKCIQPNPSSHRYAEGDLLKGEAVCIDRCSAKFFEVNKVVGERMQAMGGAAQANGSFGR
jgi:import inner membrane translocase subunit TIM10